MSLSVMHPTSLYLLLTFLLIIDASRILYLPLARLHPSHREFQPARHIAVEEKLIDNELFPLSAMEAMAAEDYETERRELDHLTLTDADALRSNEVHMGHDQRAAAIQQHSERSNSVDADERWPVDAARSHIGRLQFGEAVSDSEQRQQRNDALFLLIVGTCSVFGILGLVAAAIFWYRIQRRAEEALDSDYPSYGVSGPSNSGGKIAPNSAVSDRKLAQSAQMFHYQQQRQQMMAQEKAHLDAKPTHSDDSDDEAPHGGDYTVYECPGLAPTGEMEVRNPLFAEPEPPSSAAHPSTNNHYPQPSSAVPSASTQEKPSS